MTIKSPKTIATINFKGGVGKTTVTWVFGGYCIFFHGFQGSDV